MANFYLAHEYWFAVVQLVLAMLGMGATLTLRDFREVLAEPRAFAIGMAVQLLLVPLIALAFIQGLGLVGSMAIAIALLAAVPGGTISNVFTYFARGNAALSITITAITTLACMITTPIILRLVLSESLPADFHMPAGKIAFEIGFCLLLPLIGGMLYLYAYPASAQPFAKWCIRGSIAAILAIALGAMSAGRLDLNVFGLPNAVLITGFCFSLTAAALIVTRMARLPRADSSAIGMEVVVRNINLGILINASLFPAAARGNIATTDYVLLSMLLYGGLQLVLGGGLIALLRRQKSWRHAG